MASIKEKGSSKGKTKSAAKREAEERAAREERERLERERLERERAEAEDEDEDEDEDEESEDEEDDEESDEQEAVPARAARRRAAPEQLEETEPEEDAPTEEDPTWWTPHLVLSIIVLLGVLGFFGVFNKILAPIIPRPIAQSETATETAPATKTEAAAPAPKPMPPPTPQPQAAPADTTMYGARHLLVMYKGSLRAPATVTRTKEEAKKRAQEAQKKAKAPGAKFEELVKAYSDEPGADKGGTDMKFRKGQMVPEFQAAVEKMKVGEISDLVETQFGYHVILRTQ